MRKNYAALIFSGLTICCTSNLSAVNVYISRTDAVRLVGIIIALGGAGACAFKGSKIVGPTLCVAGLATALGSDRLIEVVDQELNQGGWFTRTIRDAKRDIASATEELRNG